MSQTDAQPADIGKVRRRANKLVAFTASAVLIGGMVGAFLPGWLPEDKEARASWLSVIGFPGKLLMNLLKMLVVPLITCTMIVGVSSLGDFRKAGKLGLRTLIFYSITSTIAVITGIVLVTTIRPGEAGTQAAEGAAAALPGALAQPKGTLQALLEAIEGLFPPNLFKAAVETQVLGLLVFSMVLGIVLTMMGERGRNVLRVFEGLNDALMKIVQAVIWYAPIGIASLVMERMGRAGPEFWSEVTRLGWYMVTVLAGLGIHGFVVYPGIYWLVTRRNPYRFLAQGAQAYLTAFSTASSAATMPVTLQCMKQSGVSERTLGFVIPIGTTANMDGTALYEAVAVIFIAQCLGIELSGPQLVIVFLTATLAAVGAAAIPEAGLVMMAIVLTAIGIEPTAAALILAVDWLLDRFRTTVNVQGDTFGAAVIDHFESRPPASA